MFLTRKLDHQRNPFGRLVDGIEFEKFSDSRQGAIAVQRADGLTPIVRTTTSYTNSSQHFTPTLCELVDGIKVVSGLSTLKFNNAMIEIYEPAYKKMGFHSDQSLDLVKDSTICIFSCYENDQEPNPRKLIMKSKENGSTSEIIMEHNSCILFSTSTNDQYLHKIVSDHTQSRWLGLTLRLSSTFVYPRDGNLFFAGDDVKMTRASESERKEFLRHKSRENAQIGYSYPYIAYTLSEH